MSFKKALRDEAEAVFAARKDKPDYVEYEFKDYKGALYFEFGPSRILTLF